MSAHVLLNLLNKFGKRDKMPGLPSILSLFRNEFYKFSNTLEHEYYIKIHEPSCFIVFLNELEKRDKMQDLPSILSLFSQ